jgi:hypothetical protein
MVTRISRKQINFADADTVIAVASTPYTITSSANDGRLFDIDCSAAAIAVTLPSVSASIGQKLAVKKNGASNSLTITPATGTIDGAGSLVLYDDNSIIMLMSDGTNWHIVTHFEDVGSPQILTKKLVVPAGSVKVFDHAIGFSGGYAISGALMIRGW